MGKFLSDRRVWLIVILVLLITRSLLSLWNLNGVATGYTIPTDLTVYGMDGDEAIYTFSEYMKLDYERVKAIEIDVFISSYEKTDTSKHVLLSVTENAKIKSCMALLDESLEIVDVPANYCVEYRLTAWPPYTFTFTMDDGTSKSCGVSMIDEPSRIIETNNAYLEMLTAGDLFTQLQETYGMLPYPNLFESTRTQSW